MHMCMLLYSAVLVTRGHSIGVTNGCKCMFTQMHGKPFLGRLCPCSYIIHSHALIVNIWAIIEGKI